MTKLKRKLLLFGASGQIGSALHQRLGSLYHSPIQVVPWTNHSQWVSHALEQLDRHLAYDFIFACGLTNPRESEKALTVSNLEFPVRVMEQALSMPSVRFVTLGTVMELFPGACDGNAYLQSKLLLSQEVLRLSRQHAHQFRHVRLHTVYGGERRHLKSHMFLGQMVAALETGTEFQMSSGDQLREYHGVVDLADAMALLLESHWDRGAAEPLVHFSHGQPCRLADLAKSIFSAFGKAFLLQIGKIARAPVENTAQIFPSTVGLSDAKGPIHGVVEWLQSVITVT